MKNSQTFARIIVPALLLFSTAVFCGTASLAATPAHQSAVAQTTATGYNTPFANGAWKLDDWLLLRNPYSSVIGKWVQKPDHIENAIPDGLTVDEAVKTRIEDLYVSMVLKNKIEGPATISTTTSFTPQYAPLIILANDLEEAKPGEFYPRKYLEIVIYDEGINFWQHWYEGGKERHFKAAWSNFKLKPNKKYKLTVKVNGNMIEANVDGHTLGWRSPDMPNSFYAGIVACEGLNKFYDFNIKPYRP
ncbi:MAG TPA: hypothetical protein VGK34_03325 [Armatimonadota bacterium]|jgi:hypothetical protein